VTLAKTNGKNWKGTRKQKKSGESRKKQQQQNKGTENKDTK
jgi:hypothetical protein